MSTLTDFPWPKKSVTVFLYDFMTVDDEGERSARTLKISSFIIRSAVPCARLGRSRSLAELERCAILKLPRSFTLSTTYCKHTSVNGTCASPDGGIYLGVCRLEHLHLFLEAHAPKPLNQVILHARPLSDFCRHSRS